MITKFYFPLTVSEFEYDEFGGYDENSEYEMDGKYAAAYGREILDKFLSYTSNFDENMAGYFDESEKLHIKAMDWRFEYKDGGIYGIVEVDHDCEFSESEIMKIKDYIEGQNSDGLGEGFEQQEIRTDEGVLLVHFWNSSDDYFVDTEKEFYERINDEDIEPFEMEGM